MIKMFMYLIKKKELIKGVRVCQSIFYKYVYEKV